MHILTGRDWAFAGLLVGMLMASLDINVVVAALPSVGASLGDPGMVAGVTGAYLLVVAVSTPMLGSLGDRWGRRRIFVGSVLVFAAGSLACALAPSMAALVGFRAVQGLGGSGLIVAAISALAELFDRAALVARQGWQTAVFALSTVGGAPLGGFLAAGPGWRWIFLVNLPVSAVALLLGARAVPGRGAGGPVRGSGVRGFDVRGAVLVAVAGAAVVLLGSGGGFARSPVWAPVLAAVAVVAGVGFVRSQRRAAVPLIPPAVFGDPGFARAALATVCSGVALFGSFTFVPLAIGAGAAATGLLLLPMAVGQVVCSTAFAALARRWPAITAWGRCGLALGVLGLGATAAVPMLALGGARTALLVAGLACSGAALGLSMQAYTLVGQSRAPSGAVGSAMASLIFARQIGGSLGIAAFGWVSLLLPGAVGLTAVFGLAAAALLAGLVTAPRAVHDPAAAPAASVPAR